MDEAAFFQAGDDLDFPSGGGAHPVEEGAAVAGVAESAGCHHAHPIGSMSLCRAMEPPQHSHGVCHGLRVEDAVGENALAQARNFAIFVKSFETAAHGFCDFESDRV